MTKNYDVMKQTYQCFYTHMNNTYVCSQFFSQEQTPLAMMQTTASFATRRSARHTILRRYGHIIVFDMMVLQFCSNQQSINEKSDYHAQPVCDDNDKLAIFDPKWTIYCQYCTAFISSNIILVGCWVRCLQRASESRRGDGNGM